MNNRHSTILVAASSWISKVVIVLTQLIVIRVLLERIGIDGYAVFALLMGLQGWFFLADMGIGSSVQNYISEALATNQNTEEIVFFGRLVSVFLLLATICVLYMVSPIVGPWFLQKLYVPPANATDLFFLTGALYICASIGGVVYKIWYAERRGYLSNALPACAAVIGLIGVGLTARSDHEYSLIAYVAMFIGPTAAIPLIALVYQSFKDGVPNNKALANQVVFKAILRRGFYFWLFSAAAALTLQVDYIVMSQILTPDDIALYSLMMKVFGIPFFIYTALLTAAWPVITEYATMGQWAKIRHCVHGGVVAGSTLLLLSTLILVWIMHDVINLIAPSQAFVAPVGLIMSMGLYWMLRSWTDTFALVLQSMSKFKVLTTLVPIQGILSVCLQLTFAPIYGVYGILMGLIGSFILTVSWWLPVTTYRYLNINKDI